MIAYSNAFTIISIFFHFQFSILNYFRSRISVMTFLVYSGKSPFIIHV